MSMVRPTRRRALRPRAAARYSSAAGPSGQALPCHWIFALCRKSGGGARPCFTGTPGQHAYQPDRPWFMVVTRRRFLDLQRAAAPFTTRLSAQTDLYRRSSWKVAYHKTITDTTGSASGREGARSSPSDGAWRFAESEADRRRREALRVGLRPTLVGHSNNERLNDTRVLIGADSACPILATSDRFPAAIAAVVCARDRGRHLHHHAEAFRLHRQRLSGRRISAIISPKVRDSWRQVLVEHKPARSIEGDVLGRNRSRGVRPRAWAPAKGGILKARRRMSTPAAAAALVSLGAEEAGWPHRNVARPPRFSIRSAESAAANLARAKS